MTGSASATGVRGASNGNNTNGWYVCLALATVAAFVGVPPASGQAEPPVPAVSLQEAAEEIAGSVPGTWGLMAWSIGRRETLIAVGARRVLVPASNNKIFTSIWALDRLGPDHRFQTEVQIAGEVGPDGTLHGDVILKGSGDPGFGAPEYLPDPMAPLRIMAGRVRESGVRVVTGRVIGDASIFDGDGLGPAWPADTGGGSSAYAPRASGLAFHRNVIGVRLEPTRPGELALVELTPPVEEIPVVSLARTGGGRVWAVRRDHDETIYVRGAVAGVGRHRYDVGVLDPAVLAAGALRRALIDEGILVQGSAVNGAAPAAATPLHRHVSVPLRAMIVKLNRDSDNFFAEQIYLATVAEVAGIGSFDLGGPASAIFFHRAARVPLGEVYQADGSGLSAYNRASAYALVCALVYAHHAPYAAAFHRSLAIAGERNGGTMRRMFVGTEAAGNLRGKTGFVRGARTLSGYVRTRDGDLVAFSFLYNGGSTSAAREAQEKLGGMLAAYTREAPAEAGVPGQPRFVPDDRTTGR